MKSVAIIGAGITGLTAAFYLKRKGIPATVYEASGRGGGVIQSLRQDGYLAEFGPYFTDMHRTPWGSAINLDGAGSDEVRAFLREKLAQAERTIGRGLDVLPRLSAGKSGRLELPPETIGATSLSAADSPPIAVAELRGEIHRTLERWRRPSPHAGPLSSDAVVAAVWASLEGWLAVLDDGHVLAHLTQTADRYEPYMFGSGLRVNILKLLLLCQKYLRE
jgi:phytoene dehydrogenase-like protein